ncbi:hypothetical protein EXIGLDRAFT_838793 [Exidia glandulosa HHB12029]|uniref:F-box domain-containing protein n=1 Tax=Exidia glandulosa HHB12029 TaxID=1314781 RepID=A0A165FH97_EXIGL|nr:hypothetical protein EXIGLDRAFT_838793 [Exidia glandulosa HHB12029]
MPPRRRTVPPRPSRFVGLPTEILTMIASYLTLVELARVLVIYRDWHALLTSTPSLWQLIHIDLKEYPSFPLLRILGYSKGFPLSLRLRSINSLQIGTAMPAHLTEEINDVLSKIEGFSLGGRTSEDDLGGYEKVREWSQPIISLAPPGSDFWTLPLPTSPSPLTTQRKPVYVSLTTTWVIVFYDAAVVAVQRSIQHS